jgi:hypothetical protein
MPSLSFIKMNWDSYFMKCMFTLLLFSVILAPPAGAQAPLAAARGPVIKAGIGVAYLDFDESSSARTGLLGVVSEVTADLSPKFGAEIEVGYLRASNVLHSGHHSDILSYVGGPVWHPIRRRNFQTYIHGLIGLARVTGPVRLSAGGTSHGYVNKGCLEFGAGAKFRLDGPIYLIIGVDYLHSEYVNPLLQFRGQNSLRTTASVEYVLGGHRRR